MRVAVVAEYYPRRADPVLGVWAHRQALAARAHGAEIEVLVLHRPVPPRSALAARDPRGMLAPLRQPLRETRDGIGITYVPFPAPPRPRSYPRWGAYAALPLALALRALRRRFPYDLVHAHYAAPAGDAVRRARPGAPYVVSVHGGDVLGVARKWSGGAAAVRHGLEGAALALCNSAGTEALARELGARRTRVLHLGTDVPPAAAAPDPARIVTVGNLVARKRHADVLRALTRLPELTYEIVGDGPERPALEALARELGVAERVIFRGALPHAEAVAAARHAGAFVLPSHDEAFGVAYVEAMAGGTPAVGRRGEPGPEEIARCGPGMTLAGGDLPAAVRQALATDRAAARATVVAHFTWERCGKETVAAYEEALGG